MSAMYSTTRPPAGSEQVIGALIPAAIPRPCPVPAPLPVLTARRRPAESDVPLLDMARLDRSGRLSARALLRAMGWLPGHRLDVDVVDAAVLVASAVAGRCVVDVRGEFALPAAARQLCGIGPGSAVVLAGYPPLELVIIHPAGAVAQLLREVHARLVAGGA